MKLLYFGGEGAETLLVQPMDRRDLETVGEELSLLRGMTEEPFRLAALAVDDWDRDLSPWPAPPVYGAEEFGGGAADTLAFLLRELPGPAEARRVFLGGYSLAGLFALWAAYRTDRFAGAAAASPSVWFPGFRAYVREEALRTDAVYLSLGTREEKTKHPVMAQVGDAIRDIHAHLERTGTPCALEWNEGNHFREPEKRMARGFAWLMRRGAGAAPGGE